MSGIDIGLDIDNVLYPWATVFTRWVEERKGLKPGVLDDIALSWNWYKDQWGMTLDEMQDHFRAGVRAGVVFAQGSATEGSVAAVRRWANAGHRIHYVTDRANAGIDIEHAWEVTHTWLHGQGFVVDSLTITPDKASVKADVFLDDGPHYIRAMIAEGQQHAWLWDRPHNRHEDLPRLYTWHQVDSSVAAVAETLTPNSTERTA